MSTWTLADIPALSGTTALVTGGNSGIGWHTALELARAGAKVIITSRTSQKGEGAVAAIKEQVPQARVEYRLLDLANLDSVRRFAEPLADTLTLDLLVNNAGVMRIPARLATVDGFERQLATNFIGPFALTLLLLPALRRSSRPRVTTVSSVTAAKGKRRIDFDDPQGAHQYSAKDAYCQSKLADLMLMLELGRRCQAIGVPLVSNASHPGWSMTRLQTSGPGRSLNTLEKIAAHWLAQDAAHGALSTLRACTEVDSHSGDYYGPTGLLNFKGAPGLLALPAPALDKQAASQLWDRAEQWTGLCFRQAA